jgi:hypothetical protein
LNVITRESPESWRQSNADHHVSEVLARPGVDEMSDNDEQDLAHLMAVISHAMATITSRRVNSGKIDVITEDGMASVRTEQAVSPE